MLALPPEVFYSVVRVEVNNAVVLAFILKGKRHAGIYHHVHTCQLLSGWPHLAPSTKPKPSNESRP